MAQLVLALRVVAAAAVLHAEAFRVDGAFSAMKQCSQALEVSSQAACASDSVFLDKKY